MGPSCVRGVNGNELERAFMRYKPKRIAALHVALGGLPDKMRVEVEADIGASPRTVGELRKMTSWPENLALQPLRKSTPKA
jgi:hypothetical protein